MTAAFERSEFEGRVQRARAAMAEAGADVLVADNGELLAWLTGYTVSETMYRAAFLPRDGDPWFVLRSLDAGPARDQAWFDDIVGFPDTASPEAVMAEELSRRGHGRARIGVDTHSYGFTVATAEALRRGLPEAAFVPMPDVGSRLRACKSAAEIAVLRQAAGIADKAMAALGEELREGMTVRDAAGIAARVYLQSGADTGEVGPIVKSAGHNEFLHGAFIDGVLSAGDVLHAELIPKVRNYSARMMRSLVVGEPSDERDSIAAELIALQDRQIAAMRPGARACDVDRIVREGVLSAGLRPTYENVTAYTLGLVTRTPRTSDFSGVFLPTSDWSLEAGMVFHVYTSAAGLAISETVVVRKEGGERLTGFSRKLLCLPT